MFNTKERTQMIDDFIAGSDKVEKELITEQESIWSTANLKKLSVEEIENRLEAVDDQSTLIKWRLWWALRQKYKSDKLFGKHIEMMRVNSTRPDWPSSSRDISRSVAAGRFCERHKINDLRALKVYKESIYALALIPDSKIAATILNEVRHRHIPVESVRKMIMDATRVISVVEKVDDVNPNVQLLPSDAYMLQFDKIAQNTEVSDEPGVSINPELYFNDKPSHKKEPEIVNDPAKESHSARYDLLRELVMVDAREVTDDYAVKEVLVFLEQYKRGDFLKELGFYKAIIQALQAKIAEIQLKSYTR